MGLKDDDHLGLIRKSISMSFPNINGVTVSRKPLKIAIIGLAPSSHDLAPWGDGSWLKWGLPWDAAYWPMLDACFEMHDISEVTDENYAVGPGECAERLSDCFDLWMPRESKEFPHAKAYPLADVSRTIGGDYFVSSASYMLALAIHHGAYEIGLWGFDMEDDSEYAYQRANIEYLIGLARGKGIKVTLPESSPLCRYKPTFAHYPNRYGCLE